MATYSKPITLDQSVVNPVGNMENTDSGPPKCNPPSLVTSGEVSIVPGVSNPVGNKSNTGPGLL